MKKRVEWNGDTSQVAFVFEFFFEQGRYEGDFPLLDDFEISNPGVLKAFCQHYVDNKEKWLSGKVKLSKDQVEILELLVASVNQWHDDRSSFFAGMKPSWLVGITVNDWDKKDKKGLKNFQSSVDWWWSEPSERELPMWDLVVNRVLEEFGEDTYLSNSFSNMGTSEDILGLLNFLFNIGYPYHTDDFFYTTDEDGEQLLPTDKEMKAIQKFFSSNAFLCDFKEFYEENTYRLEP